MSKRSPLALTLPVALGLAAGAAAALEAKPETTAESVCGLIESAARTQGLPVAFLARLIWRESAFEPGVTSPAGAEGIAQFMPGTAADRGLANPFDPEEAIPKAAELIAELKAHFGNLGLAAAAYNAGPGRLADWLASKGSLPVETRDYVVLVTRHPVEEWTGDPPAASKAGPLFPESSCLQEIAALRVGEPSSAIVESPITAPWGVQIAGSFSKAAALAAFARDRKLYAAVLGNVEPILLGGPVRARGFSPFYRVRAPAATRAEADGLCNRLLRIGAACAVLRN